MFFSYTEHYIINIIFRCSQTFHHKALHYNLTIQTINLLCKHHNCLQFIFLYLVVKIGNVVGQDSELFAERQFICTIIANFFSCLFFCVPLILKRRHLPVLMGCEDKATSFRFQHTTLVKLYRYYHFAFRIEYTNFIIKEDLYISSRYIFIIIKLRFYKPLAFEANNTPFFIL